jgi:hypothetical protein
MSGGGGAGGLLGGLPLKTEPLGLGFSWRHVGGGSYSSRGDLFVWGNTGLKW